MGSDGMIEHNRNSSRSLKINALRTINRLDDVGPPDLRSSSSSIPSIVSPPYSHSSSVVLFSLVEQLSAVYEQDEGRRRLLTSSICQSLVNLNIMSPTLLLDELAGLRAHYRQAFLRLVTVARAKLPESRTSLPALPGPEHYLAAGSLVKWLPESLFQYSRYNQEFEEGGYIGGGGFGVVYKSTNRLDGVTYAVKKVFIKLAKQQSILLKIFREVTLLAKLNHPNIVSYKSAWLEPLLENAASSEETTSSASQPMTSSGVSFDLSPSMSESGLKMSATVERITDVEELGWTLWPNSVERVIGVAGTPPGGKVRKSKFWVGDEDNTESSSVVFKEDSESIQFRLDESESESVGDCGDKGHMNGLRTVEPIDMPIARPGVKFNIPMESMDNVTPPLLGGAVLYIQMELCSTTLRAWLDNRNSGGLVDFKNIFCIFQQLLLAVEHLHDNGILHRDVKPRNIFLNESLDLKLGDFGLAKEYLADEPSTPGDELRDVTFRRSLATGSSTSGVGTQAYASPEQLNSKNVDLKTDVFSLGVVLFELLLPFSTEMERVTCITDLKEGQSDRLKLLQPSTADLITRMTDHQPSARPSVKEVQNSHFSNKDFHMLEKDVEKEQEMKILRREVDLQKKTIQKQEELIQAQEEELEVLRKLLSRVSMSP